MRELHIRISRLDYIPSEKKNCRQPPNVYAKNSTICII